MFGRRTEIPRMQSDFYRDSYYRVLRWLMAAIVVVWLLIVAIIYVALFHPATHYFATTSEGQIIPMTPVSE